ncbi:MAG: hypothetical protein WB713_06345 [Methyloceanibacter sp.]
MTGVFKKWQSLYAEKGIATFPVNDNKKPCTKGYDKAHQGQAKIKLRLIADLDPDEWHLPPKPKWMRWSTYNRYLERHDAYEAIRDYGIAELMAKFLSK